jgi:hypothetical protein
LNGDAFCADFRRMPFWSAARIRSEPLALVCLAERGFQVFAPRIATRRGPTLLFPAHLFVLIVDRWHAVDCTPGVLKLIRFGDTPSKVPDAEIAAIPVGVMMLDMIGDRRRRDVAGLEAGGAERLDLELMPRARPPALEIVPRPPMERLRGGEVASVHQATG